QPVANTDVSNRVSRIIPNVSNLNPVGILRNVEIIGNRELRYSHWSAVLIRIEAHIPLRAQLITLCPRPGSGEEDQKNVQQPSVCHHPDCTSNEFVSQLQIPLNGVSNLQGNSSFLENLPSFGKQPLKETIGHLAC